MGGVVGSGPTADVVVVCSVAEAPDEIGEDIDGTVLGRVGVVTFDTAVVLSELDGVGRSPAGNRSVVSGGGPGVPLISAVDWRGTRSTDSQLAFIALARWITSMAKATMPTTTTTNIQRGRKRILRIGDQLLSCSLEA